MLYELFSWMCDNEQPLPSSQEIVTLTGYESEIQLVKKRLRVLLADLRSISHGGSSELGESESQQKVTHYEQYLQFLEFCRQELCLPDNENPHFLALKYCMSLQVRGENSHKTAVTITKLFLMLLKEDKENTIEFYQQHKQAFTKLKQIIFAVDLVTATDKTRMYLEQLTSQLKGEENPLTIAPLFIQFFDETEKYVAAILWVLHRVPVKQLLQTGLLQNVMVYYLAYLTIKNGPIQSFYKLLSQFPEAKLLIKRARRTRCEERGFDSFSLTGERPGKTSLRRVEVLLPSPVLTPTEENFNVLYQLFGLAYLKLAIEGYAQYNDKRWGHILHDFLNRDGGQLPIVINLIVTSSPGMLEVLASLIDDAVVETLATQHNGVIFHFLPYKSALLVRLISCDLKFYLKQLCAGAAPAFEKMSQLLVLLNWFRNSNKGSAVLTYEGILDLVLENRGLLEDRILLKALRKFAAKDKVIESRSRELHARWHTQFTLCIKQAQTVKSISTDSYQAMEDTWSDVSSKLAALNIITPINRSCPLSKYNFQVLVAREFYSKCPNEFNLDNFFQAVEIPAEILVNRVSTYERLLVELITTLDDQPLRQTIIGKLAIIDKLIADQLITIEAGQEKSMHTDEETRERWMHTEYDGENAVKKAAKQDNVGLITWLDENIDLGDIESTANEAAETGSWKVVNYFCRSDRLSQRALKGILFLAAASGQDELVNFLCCFVIVNLLKKDVIQAFMQAANNQHTEVMRFFWSIKPKAINETMIANAFKIATQMQRLTSMAFLGNLMESRLLLRAVETALMHATVHDRFVVVQQLCGLQANAPRLGMIEEAFLKAFANGNFRLARYFCKLPGYALNQSVIDKALKTAGAARSMRAMAFVFDLENYYPSQTAIEQTLMKLAKAKCIDGVRLLCGLTRNTPRERAIEQALFLAIRHGAYSCVVHFSRLINPQVIPKAIQWAAQYGTLKILLHCCRLHPPDQKEIQAALKKVSSQHHGVLSSYLHSLLPFVTSSCTGFWGVQASSRPRTIVMGITRHASTSCIDKCGFFGHKANVRRHSSASDYSDDVAPIA